MNIPIVDVLGGWPLSCQEAKSLDLSRQERVDDEDYGLGTAVEIQLLKANRKKIRMRTDIRFIILYITLMVESHVIT